MKFGHRTLKTAIGVCLSVWLSQRIGLQFPTAAGILTILCIQVTKRRSLINAYSRFAACLLGVFAGFLIFKAIGYHPLSLFILILLFVPVLVRIRIQEGFVTSFVIILHLYTVKAFTLSFLMNELSIMGIGIGMALLMNVYMPNIEGELLNYQRKIEENFRVILAELSVYLRKNESLWDGNELIETEALINQAKSLAIRNVENHLLRNKDYHYHYFQMREQQFELLKRMVPLISALNCHLSQSQKIADFLEHISQNIHPGNTAYIFLDKLNLLREEIRRTELPKSLEEFETRASLHYFLKEMERYLLIKREYKPRQQARHQS